MQSFRLCAIAALLVALVVLAGCASPNGGGPEGHGTTTVLKSKNFTVSDRVSSKADCAFIFGSAFSAGPFWINLPGIPLGDYELYKRARAELAEQAKGRDLVNVTQDYRVTSYFGFYTIHTLTLTADTVTFN